MWKRGSHFIHQLLSETLHLVIGGLRMTDRRLGLRGSLACRRDNLRHTPTGLTRYQSSWYPNRFEITLSGNMIEHKGQRLLADQGERNMDTCKRGHLCYSVWLIIKANDGDVARNLQTRILNCFHGSRRAII